MTSPSRQRSPSPTRPQQVDMVVDDTHVQLNDTVIANTTTTTTNDNLLQPPMSPIPQGTPQTPRKRGRPPKNRTPSKSPLIGTSFPNESLGDLSIADSSMDSTSLRILKTQSPPTEKHLGVRRSRGRPPKLSRSPAPRRLVAMNAENVENSTTLNEESSTKQSDFVGKPREEMPFSVLFPGLDGDMPLRVRVCGEANENVLTTPTRSPKKTFGTPRDGRSSPVNRGSSPKRQHHDVDMLIDSKRAPASSSSEEEEEGEGGETAKSRKGIDPTVAAMTVLPTIPSQCLKPIPPSTFKKIDVQHLGQLVPLEQQHFEDISTSDQSINPNEPMSSVSCLPSAISPPVPGFPSSQLPSILGGYNSKALTTTTGLSATNTTANASPIAAGPFRLPPNFYIRYIEPTEHELDSRVEYDMDEQDKCWLNLINEQRRRHGHHEVPDSFFEVVMDRLEKEWFNLTKDIPKKTVVTEESAATEETVCAICDDGECENSNAIVFCDGCNLAVHQDCYGIPYIPEGQWLCRKCMLSPDKPVKCIFCPTEGGAYKQTTSNQWAHLLCGMWIPETGVSNPVYMEPIDNIEKIPRSRWKLVCYLCKQKVGACIQCDSKNCYTAFHVTCARRAGLFLKMKHGTEHDVICFRKYCDKHTPREYSDRTDLEASVAAYQELCAHMYAKKPATAGGGSRKKNASRKRRDYYDDDDDDESDYYEDVYGDSEEEFVDYVFGDDEDDESYGAKPGQRRRGRPSKRGPGRPFKNGSGSRSVGATASPMASPRRGRPPKNPQPPAVVVQQPSSTSFATVNSLEYSSSTSLLDVGKSLQSVHSSSQQLPLHVSGYDAGHPVIPVIIAKRVIDQLRNHRVAEKKQFLYEVCKYWALKREARRGAPLLKRLHLEPWTASSSAYKEDEKMREQRLQSLYYLRKDLERVRTLADEIKRREKLKLTTYRLLNKYVEKLFQPVTYVCRKALEEIRKYDRQQFFAEPVPIELVPDYYDIIKNPISFIEIAAKIESYSYQTVESFEADVKLLVDNCMIYNKKDTIYWRAASRLWKHVPAIMAMARHELNKLPKAIDESGEVVVKPNPSLFPYGLPDWKVEEERVRRKSELEDRRKALEERKKELERLEQEELEKSIQEEEEKKRKSIQEEEEKKRKVAEQRKKYMEEKKRIAEEEKRAAKEEAERLLAEEESIGPGRVTRGRHRGGTVTPPVALEPEPKKERVVVSETKEKEKEKVKEKEKEKEKVKEKEKEKVKEKEKIKEKEKEKPPKPEIKDSPPKKKKNVKGWVYIEVDEEEEEEKKEDKMEIDETEGHQLRGRGGRRTPAVQGTPVSAATTATSARATRSRVFNATLPKLEQEENFDENPLLLGIVGEVKGEGAVEDVREARRAAKHEDEGVTGSKRKKLRKH